MYLRELSGSKFHSVTVILYNDVKNSISSKVDLSRFGTELFNYIPELLINFDALIFRECFSKT